MCKSQKQHKEKCVGLGKYNIIFEAVLFYSYVAYPYQVLIKSTDFKLSN